PREKEAFGLDPIAFSTWTKPMIAAVNRPPKNARFKIADKRVTEFVQNVDGRSVDELALYRDTLEAISKNVEPAQTNQPISLTMEIQKAPITTASVNDLGITDKLGEGYSTYKGSPKNRKKNIQNGVRLLNGLLIAPGDTFSLLEALRPFTIENGYLPELVIKGDKIEPELGGGLCQIGTTTFRAVMHAGLPILERSNHSLMVSYYNDPINKNPGTYATIYEPAPDFKFLNDTGYYLLLSAENLTDKQQLRFTFWGTSDGRKGTYSPPIILKRFPVGEPIMTESVDLKPGEEKCQEAHAGANATFTYTIKHPDGTQTDKIFNSHYRPLPKMCLIGVAEKEQIETEPTP
ncbi:MAG: VanW family protein, partial [Patescibacteria group bacterium]